MQIRPIQEHDNKVMAKIIRQVLTEFGANKPGFAWQDPELDVLSETYFPENRTYLVVEDHGTILGGGGIAEFSCQLSDCCELQKMYLLPEARGKGFGAALISSLLSEARDKSYRYCYLETLSSMHAAVGLYLKQGFKLQASPLGDSGHNACDEWYLLDLDAN